MLTVLVHGFWGGPGDWNEVLKRLPLGLEVWTPDLYEPGALAPHHTLEEWVHHFQEEVAERAKGEPVQVVGYSMGGRLLLQTLLAHPKLFSRALILSARPFALGPDEARERRSWELSWREKFLTKEWSELEKEWESLGVFQGSYRPERREGSQLREMLGQSLVHWSPADVAHRPQDLKALPSTVDWAFGALDQKYTALAKDLATASVRGQINVIENAGHRLPFDAPDWVASWIVKE